MQNIDHNTGFNAQPKTVGHITNTPLGWLGKSDDVHSEMTDLQWQMVEEGNKRLRSELR